MDMVFHGKVFNSKEVKHIWPKTAAGTQLTIKVSQVSFMAHSIFK